MSTKEEKATHETGAPVETDPVRVLAAAIQESNKIAAETRDLIRQQVGQTAGAMTAHDASALAVAAAKDVAAQQENTRVHAARTPKSMRLATGIALAKVAEEPTVQITFTATGHVRGVGEEHEGQFFVTNVEKIDFGAADAAIQKDSESHFAGPLADAQRANDEPAIAEIRRIMGGKGGRGLKHRRATEVHMPLIRRVVGKTVERLISDGAVRVVEETTAQAAQ